jgi:cell wall-associated protease
MILENIRHKGFAGIVIVIIFFAFSGFGNGDDFLNEIASVKSSIANNSSDDLQGWESLDPEKDEYEGVRTKAFYKYLETLPFVPERKEVVVAVIDSGFDIEHPDLKDHIWNNETEINGVEGVDDDENGYVDDFYGWNFLGDKTNTTLEVTREYYRLKSLKVSETDVYFLKVKKAYEDKIDETVSTQAGISETLNEYEKAEDILRQKNITTDPNKLMGLSQILEGKYQDAASIILGIYMLFGTDKNALLELNESFDLKMKYNFDSLDVDDNSIEDLIEKNYGNNNVMEKKMEHGTHVAGTIASGKVGQAPFAKIMCLKTIPTEGDERDKDVGNAIRYAADNGADIINMSAGKYFSPRPDFVADAIRYAEEKGVLFIISAGNEAEDISIVDSYPKKYMSENGVKKYFSNMIVIGASSWMQKWSKEKDPGNKNVKYDLAAPFSNYSKEVVDVFAPGVEIYSTIPNNSYKSISGTSMASPVVTGVAAILKAYFPQLTAAQLKEIIVSSARQYPGLKVKVKDKSKLLFSDLSKSGGVVDIINAYKKASEVAGVQN